MVYLYLWTEKIVVDFIAYPNANPVSTNITVLKYKTNKDNTNLAAVNFIYVLDKNNIFPSNFTNQITNESKQMENFSYLSMSCQNISTGLPKNSSIGDCMDKNPIISFGLSSANISTNHVTIATADGGITSDDNDILAYVHGVHFDIVKINSASDSNAISYTLGINEEQIDNYLIVGNPGCNDTNADNYEITATVNNGTCIYLINGCTDSNADNYNLNANIDDESCTYNILGCTNPLALNYNLLANINDGSCDLGYISGITGDPHILTIGGNRLEIPQEINNYILLKSKDFLINISTQIKNNEALLKLIYCSFKNSCFLLDIDSLEVLESTNFNLNFNSFKVGINTLRIEHNKNLFSFLFNKEVNGLIVTIKKNSFSQENSKGLLLSDNINKCIITNLYA